MDIIVVDPRDVRVRDDYEGKVPQSLYSVSKPYGEEGECEVGGAEQSFC